MKSILIVSALIGSSAFGKTIGIGEFKGIVSAYTKILAKGEAEVHAGSCTFTLDTVSKGLVLTIQTEKAGSTQVMVPTKAKIKVQGTEQDDQYNHEYDIPGGSTVIIVHVADMYDELSLVNRHSSHTCGVYY